VLFERIELSTVTLNLKQFLKTKPRQVSAMIIQDKLRTVKYYVGQTKSRQAIGQDKHRPMRIKVRTSKNTTCHRTGQTQTNENQG